MRLDKLTEKSREALLEAQHLAEQYTHPAVEPAPAADPSRPGRGVVPSVVRKIGGDPTLLRGGVEAALSKLPRATGSSVQVGLSRDLNHPERGRVHRRGDEGRLYSTEHMLMAMAQPKGAAPATYWPPRHRLQRHPASTGHRAGCSASLARTRRRSTRRWPEYGSDLTQEARRGKLDRSLAATRRSAASCNPQPPH
jgi:ATP-dependent Clp protease ATP-binding subunit ClpB